MAAWCSLSCRAREKRGVPLDISAVIPAFNEGRSLAGTLGLLDRFLGGEAAGADVEVLVVDDGSTDGTSRELARLASGSRLRVLRHERNRGKGAAVRTGVLATTGEVVIVTDADGDYLHNDAGPFLRALRGGAASTSGSAPRRTEGADIVLASRMLPGSSCLVTESSSRYVHRRRAMGRLFCALAQRIVGLCLTDTQTGLKLFRGELARSLFRDLVIEGFAFDLEVLCRARRRGCSIVELPLVYRCPTGRSTVGFWDPARMVRDMLRVRRICPGRS